MPSEEPPSEPKTYDASWELSTYDYPSDVTLPLVDEPSESFELYRTVSLGPLSIVLLALALLLQAFYASEAIIPVVVLSVTASAIGLVSVVRRSQAPMENSVEPENEET